jgi:4-carboxymuconolactone decarboxylase
MTDQPRQVGGGRRAIGDIAPKLAALTDDVLFDDVWNRPELSARDRSLITVTALIAGGHSDQLPYHLDRLSRTASHEPSSSRPSPTWRFMPAGPKQ